MRGNYQDLTFFLRVIQTPDGFGIDTPFDYIVEIEGVDISDRLSAPGVRFQHSLDIVRVNRYAVSDCNIPLRNNDGYFRNDLPNNFWTANALNPSGFLNTVKVFVEFIENGTRTPVLFFEGQITNLEMPLQNTSTLRCLSNTTRLTQINLEGAGIGIEKIAQLDTDTDNNAPVAEGVYAPESAMLPLSVSEDVQAYIHQTQLTQKEIANDALGTKDDTGFLTASDFKVQGGVFDDPVLLNYKTAYRYKTARSALEKLTKVETYLTTLLTDFENTPEVEEHISARG